MSDYDDDYAAAGNLWRIRGRDAGYPECCVEAFARGQWQKPHLYGDDGRVLCDECAKRGGHLFNPVLADGWLLADGEDG